MKQLVSRKNLVVIVPELSQVPDEVRETPLLGRSSSLSADIWPLSR